MCELRRKGELWRLSVLALFLSLRRSRTRRRWTRCSRSRAQSPSPRRSSRCEREAPLAPCCGLRRKKHRSALIHKLLKHASACIVIPRHSLPCTDALSLVQPEGAQAAPRDWAALLSGLKAGVTGRTIDGVHTGRLPEAEALRAAGKSGAGAEQQQAGARR